MQSESDIKVRRPKPKVQTREEMTPVGTGIGGLPRTDHRQMKSERRFRFLRYERQPATPHSQIIIQISFTKRPPPQWGQGGARFGKWPIGSGAARQCRQSVGAHHVILAPSLASWTMISIRHMCKHWFFFLSLATATALAGQYFYHYLAIIICLFFYLESYMVH